jgi:hypothetical protein
MNFLPPSRLCGAEAALIREQFLETNRMKIRKSVACVIAIAAASLVFSVPTVSAGPDGRVAEFKLKDKALKTKPANRDDVHPVVQEIISFDDAEAQNNDAPPADAADRLKRLKALAPKAKAEIVAFAERLKKAGEVDQFNEYVANRIKDFNQKQLSEDFKAEGGNAYALLLKAPARIDQAIADREPKDLKKRAITGTPEPVALKAGRIRTGACYAFWFVVTAGYGTDHAHTSCDSLH